MVATISSGSVTKLSFGGTVLAISPDGNTALFADGKYVRFYNISGATTSSFAFPATPTSAAFSPDGARAYVVAPALLGAWSSCTNCGSTINAWQTSSISAAGVDFLTQGSFAYLAGGASGSFNNTFNIYATCGNLNPTVNPVAGITPSGAGTAMLVRSLPSGTKMLAVDSKNLYAIAPGISAPTASGPCYPPTSPSVSSSVALPSGFTPSQLIVTPDSSNAFLLGAGSSGNSVLYQYNVSGNTLSSLVFVNSPTQVFLGGTTLDSSTLYVGANDNPGGTTGGGAVHLINISAMSDNTQIPVLFVPNLVAVRPH
jgi:hypothetical protein